MLVSISVFLSGAHPRSRGENGEKWDTATPRGGSSPLTRGKRRLLDTARVDRGLIPAHAGKTDAGISTTPSRGAHPRSRGENSGRTFRPPGKAGSSPLTRGKLPSRRNDASPDGLIPAHAGKTMLVSISVFLSGAHPRSRGENGEKWDTATPRGGSSPLTRGKRRCAAYRDGGGRLIPAHAGKTAPETDGAGALGAHPRSRGENFSLSSSQRTRGGSSPLTRGKRALAAIEGFQGRLIPAHAGKTPCRGEQRHERGAHPRSRGENPDGQNVVRGGRGSSPLTRGKRGALRGHQPGPRLIPAHAGKTSRSTATLTATSAHPRSRGENSCQRRNNLIFSGSSPLTRGKPRTRRPDVAAQRLIPAHAGKTTGSK